MLADFENPLIQDEVMN
jgi:hypothetical protein